MDLKQLADRAKAVFTKRGGTQAAKEDASELRDIYKGGGSTEDKLKSSAEAIKEPGAGGGAAAGEPGAGDAAGAAESGAGQSAGAGEPGTGQEPGPEQTPG